MKTMKYFLIAFVLLTGFWQKGTLAKESPVMRVSFGYFYDRLWPYGDWIELDGGLRVWRPTHLNRGWAPYARGTWIWTDCGWYWDSYDAFGDVVYHYGRWYYDEYYGWLWVPDYEWAPAWVEWRYDDDYIGWAPLPPYAAFNHTHGLVFSINFSINFNFFHFVRYRHFCEPNLVSYYIPDHDRYTVYTKTRVRNEYRYDRDRVVNAGIDRSFVERRGQISVRERQVNFRENDNIRDRAASVGRDRIDVSIPKERAAESRSMNISRATRASSINVDRVSIGERTRNADDRTRETVKSTEPIRQADPKVTDTRKETVREASRNDGRSQVRTGESGTGNARVRETEKRQAEPKAEPRDTRQERTRVVIPERKVEEPKVAPRETRKETPRAERTAQPRTERSRDSKSDEERNARTR